MKKKRFTEEQIIASLKEHEAGAKVADLCRRMGIAEGTFYRWKSVYGGMEVSEAINAYPTMERNQVIWAWYHPDRIAPTYEIEAFEELGHGDWRPLQRFRWKIHTTVQEAAENSVDAAHFVYVHGAAEIPRTKTIFDGVRRYSGYTLTVPGSDDAGIDRLGEISLSILSIGPGMVLQRFSGGTEMTMLGLATPVDDQLIELIFAFTVPHGLSDATRSIANAAMEEVCRQVEGDIPIWENKVYLSLPTLCDGDGPIHQYRRWFRQFYVGFDEPRAFQTVG